MHLSAVQRERAESVPLQRTSVSPARPSLALTAALTLVLLALVIARSWLCDDAYITLRTVDNLVNGLGARWNVAERVQTYTHPLWMLLLALPYALTREPYFTPLVVSWLLTALTIYVLVRHIAASPLAACWAGLTLTLSRAFTDFSTSGLENPLSHALLALCMLAAQRADFGTSLLTAALLALTRPDAILLVAPLMAAVAWPLRRSPPWAALAIGLAPLLAWAMFAVTYYGFLWPNTAYAKLGTGIAAGELAAQGLRYLFESLLFDPLTLVTCAVALLIGATRGGALGRALALGVVLHLSWVVSVGGDFMSGRFLTLPLTASVALLARCDLGPARARPALVLLSLFVGLVAPRASWRVALDTGQGMPLAGIVDERAQYVTVTGLAARLRSGPAIDHMARHQALQFRALDSASVLQLGTLGCGMFGYYAGPKAHIVDHWALTDPFLARLPAMRQLHWRVGHFARALPPGYLKTLASGRVHLTDPALARYWQQLTLIVRGPIFELARWRAIADFAFADPQRLVDVQRLRLADLVIVPSVRVAAGDPVRFGDGGLEIHFGPPLTAASVQLSIEGGQRFSAQWYASGQLVASSEVTAHGPLAVPRRSLDRLRILSLEGTGAYRLTGFTPTTR